MEKRSFPAKIRQAGTSKVITVPSSIIKIMKLKKGEIIEVIISKRNNG
mgnify:CR=1 FL=1